MPATKLEYWQSKLPALFRARWIKWSGALAALAVLAYAALFLTPVPASLRAAPPQSVEFTARDGHPLRALLVEERSFAHPVALNESSPALIAATLAAEDKRFRHHPGVDFLALGRAAWRGLTGQGWSGASTITEQLVKIADVHAGAERSLSRKLGELWQALALERHWPKERILAEYLNRLDYGNLQTGIAAASRYYFAKPPGDLSPAEAALLAGLPKAPARLNPHLHLEAATARQHWVLERMAANGAVETDTLHRALREPLHWRDRGRDFEAPQFVDLLLQRRGVVPAQGGELRTTLELELNRFAATRLTENLRALVEKHATSGAVVVIENRTGEVLALTGPLGDFTAGAGEVNGAWTVRSPGSALKPFTYLLALEAGANPSTVVPDVPTAFSTRDGLYRPNNYNHRFYGPVSLRFALGNSLNVAAIRALELAGGPEPLQRALERCGVTTLDHAPDYYGLGLTLGNGEVRLLELANAFATLARLGEYRPYRLLQPGAEHLPTATRVFSREAAYLLAEMLADNSARASSFGLDSYLAFDFPVACKTGTSSDYRDNWTLGFTPEFTVGVWVGNPDNSPMHGITGVTGAAPVLHEVFTRLHETRGTSWYAAPPGLKSYRLDPLTGRLAPPNQPSAVEERSLHAPDAVRPEDYDANGRVRLPPLYAEWLASPQNNLGNLVSGSNSAPNLQILAPPPGTSYFLDADLPVENQWIALRASGPGELRWSSPTLPLRGEGATMQAQIREGRHTLLLRDPHTGAEQETWIEVKRW